MYRLLRVSAGIAVVIFVALTPSALKAQTPYPSYPSFPAPPPPVYPAPYGREIPNAPPLEIEFGLRYWYSSGKFQKTLFDSTGALQISRLTWTGIVGNSGEGYFNVTDKGVFVKGYLGLGILGGGNLQDEDFPPVTAPYSSTNSRAQDSRLDYANIDLGYYFLDNSRGKLGGFVGYHFYHEKLNAFGCTQTATNPAICVPSIGDSVRVITQNNDWHSVRLGVAGEVTIMPNLKLSGDAAYLPYVTLNGSDTHWLRLGTDFSGPTPETGHGTGMQFEGILTYNFNNYLSLGVGGRYWRMDAPHGISHFDESFIGGALPQVEKFQTNRYGTFVQLGLKY
ncbi:MAG TPA: omptin family outer membrane protease [Xanthobacteraceae bacterium]|nr:omptin family outer membrane protease [Xanthobacteraceae bacterium]